MSLEQNIIDDKAAIESATVAVNAAQATLDTANKQLATDEAALAAAQVHLTVIDEIEAYIVAHFTALTDELKALLDKARALLLGK